MNKKELAKKAFERGYKERELKVREDDRVTQKLIDRKFKHFWENINE